MRELNRVIILSSNTRPNRRFTIKDLDRRDRKAGKLEVGVHYYIDREGYVHYGRDIEKVGVHSGKRNVGSIAVMLAGGVNERKVSQDNFTLHQRASLGELVSNLMQQHNIDIVEGHNNTCPPFDVKAWVNETL